MLAEHEIEVRVRYQETDGQGRVHHANYLTFFEMGRVEMLRASGYSYRKLEEDGVLLVVAAMQVEYFAAAYYDDLLTVRTSVESAKGARVRHRYEVYREDLLVARGFSTVACVGRDGGVRRLPAWMRAT